jgi:hypothetical protein
MLCVVVFREDCLSLCILQASSAAATHSMIDEGTRSVSEEGGEFLWLLSFFAKESNPR